MPEGIFLNPNEPNPSFMVYKEEARKVILKTLGGKSECFWILGKAGIGKTTFLLWIERFAPLYKVKPIYFHAGENLKLEDMKNRIEEETKASLFSRIFRRRKYIEKPVLILIDDVENIDDESIFKYIISRLDDEEINISVALASVDIVKKIEEIFKERDIEKIYLEMPPMDILMEMIRKRIEAGGGEDFQPFGKQLVKDIIESSSTIREVLIKLQEAI